MFINLLQSDPPLYLSLLIGVILSIVLHELAHGYVAIKLGDDTPIRLNRMTFNPMVNVGPVSLIFAAICGVAWGSMPIDPTRLRGRYAEAWVSLAGPAMNLAIAIFLFLLLVGITYGSMVAPEAAFPYDKSTIFCYWLAHINLALMIFNLIPVPPLDGSHILMNFDHRYRDFVYSNVSFQQFGFIAVWIGCFILDNQAGAGPFGLSARILGLAYGAAVQAMGA